MAETWLKRGYPVLVALLLTLVAYFQASGITQLVGAALWLATETRATTKPPSAPPAAAKTGQAIVERNPFDSETGPLRGQKSVTLPATTRDSSDPLSWPSCDGVQVLIVTESMSDRLWSVTTLLAKGESKPRQRRVGDDVAGKQVAFIGYNPRQQTPAVWLEGGDGVCQSALFVRAAEPPTPSTPREPSAAPIVPEFASKIARVSDHELKIDRSLVDMTLRDPSALMRSVRIMPDSRNGEIVGLRLSGIRAGSLLEALGMKNGDRLETINGFAMGSPEKALQAYARLSTAQRLNVRLNRAGQPLDIDVSIN